MTIAELHADEDLRRHEFPVVAAKTFLGHAAVAPLPRRVADAVKARAEAAGTGDPEASLPPNSVADTSSCGSMTSAPAMTLSAACASSTAAGSNESVLSLRRSRPARVR